MKWRSFWKKVYDLKFQGVKAVQFQISVGQLVYFSNDADHLPLSHSSILYFKTVFRNYFPCYCRLEKLQRLKYFKQDAILVTDWEGKVVKGKRRKIKVIVCDFGELWSSITPFEVNGFWPQNWDYARGVQITSSGSDKISKRRNTLPEAFAVRLYTTRELDFKSGTPLWKWRDFSFLKNCISSDKKKINFVLCNGRL